MANFKIVTWPNGIQWLKVEPGLLEESILFAKANGLNHFICDFHPTDEIVDLSFLEHYIVKGLNITFSGIKSNFQINQFTEIEILVSLFGSPVTILDFSNLKNLKILEITWNNKVQGLSSLVNLKNLNLWKYKPVSKNLDEFESYEKIVKLTLVQPAIESLEGIQQLKQLAELEIAKPKGLQFFFTKLSQNCLVGLKELRLSFCKELDFTSIPTLKNLTLLCITDSGDVIQSLEFINKKFPNLKSLIFTRTELLDGNLEYLLEHPSLEKVTIDHKKHYNMKEKEINAILMEKRNKK